MQCCNLLQILPEKCTEMIDWEKFELSLDAHSKTVNRLMRMSEEGFYNQSDDIRKRIFNPLNIFYIQKVAQEERGKYKVHLDAPVKIRNENPVESYKIKLDSLNDLQELLGENFLIMGQDLICPLSRIRRIDKYLETITLRRKVLSESLRIKYGLKREKKLSAGRAYVRSLTNEYYETYWIKFSKNSLIDDSQKDLWGSEFGSSIFLNPMDIAYIQSRKSVKEVQLKSINDERTKCPLYKFRNREGLVELLGNNLFKLNSYGGIFIQINRSSVVNIYCLMSPDSKLLRGKLSLRICTSKSLELKVGNTFIDPIKELLKAFRRN